MIAVNGWCAVVMGGVGKWGDECSVNWGDSVQTFSNLFLKTLTEGAATAEAGSLFPYFTTLTENADPLLRRLRATLKCPVGMSSLAASSGREETPIRVNNQKAREYPEGGNQVNPKSSPLQGIKTKPRQSLFVGAVKNAIYQLCSCSLILL